MDFLNGRVNAVSAVASYNFKTTQDNTTENNTNLISRNMNCTDVSAIFLSDDNVNLLQTGIRNKILNLSNGKYNIGKQSDIDLKIIMRSIYFQYGKNTSINVRAQVLDLNTRVLDWCVPEILSNIKQSDKYIMDISTLPVPLDRPNLTTQKGLRTLEITKL
uniref:Minor capsid protein P8 central region domain-containing protein n=1 Tax=viral metagenome TaxID=1070528 RepID=A0A6C0LI45_9ZZZZ